jgi:hypothetical protein
MNLLPGLVIELHHTLNGRVRPEEVVQLILEQHPALDTQTRVALTRASTAYRYSLMPVVFRDAEPPLKALTTVCELAGEPLPSTEAAHNPATLWALLRRVADHYGFTHPGSAGRDLDRCAALGMTRRRYNKLHRSWRNLIEQTEHYAHQVHLTALSRVAKTIFAADIRLEALADLDTACFVAYYTANLGRRSEFLAGPQARAFDDLAALLLARCEAHPETTGWAAIAHIFPRLDILSRVSVAERLALLDRAMHVMAETARFLDEIAHDTTINLETMVVRQGNNSSDWNALAGAFNKARDVWIALVQSLGMDDVFDRFLPGKVLRLMAADVAWWHRRTGGSLDPDTAIWATLPKPWDVMANRMTCTRGMIAEVCTTHGIDPEQRGWTAARPRTTVDRWQPTPELVHGVTVNHPELAQWLKRCGVFSGKAVPFRPTQ